MKLAGETSEASLLLARAASDPAAAAQLLPLVYEELRRLAAQQLDSERPEHTLSPTALVHEAWLRLAGPEGEQRVWNSRGHFFTAAAAAMRRILVDHARSRLTEKRGGGAVKAVLNVEGLPEPPRPPDLIALDSALSQLEETHPDLAKLVSLRYFSGLTMAQAAEVLGISLRSAYRSWSYARAWLLDEISGDT